MNLQTFIQKMPKVELHVHMQGGTKPETLLEIARRNGIKLPYDTVEGLRQWYQFKDFDHFIEIYMEAADCIKTPDDVEFMAREFLRGQAEQNIVWSEVTYTALLHYPMPWAEQLAAINRARSWAEAEFGIRMGLIVDIPRVVPEEEGLWVADWVIEGYGVSDSGGVLALGLGGPEVNNPPERYKSAFDRVRAKGIPCILHAGETLGPESIWSALRTAGSVRIGHGVRAIEDPTLMAYLKATQTPLEVCPTSNVCLGVYPSLAQHSLPKLMEAGLYVTINSDDPPMFNTTLTNEYLVCAEAFGWSAEVIQQLVLNAVHVALLPAEEKQHMIEAFRRQFTSAFNELAAE
ncbi:MAG: adenosine deaminase [Anaerolineae bacterium]|nr:adenosine deaminase [Anaerolineae bacterium]